jgi:hypothetical protein
MKLDQVLAERLSSAVSNKVRKLAERSAQGALSSAATLFSPRPPSKQETEEMVELLRPFTLISEEPSLRIEGVARELATLKIEIQAINKQAILLHGERILKAQTLLKKYHEGAFSKWLKETYGNRQTPYNFLFFYQLFSALEKELQELFDRMPKIAAYSLASKDVPLSEKKEFIKSSHSASRQEILYALKQRFPLKQEDKRGHVRARSLFSSLKKVHILLKETLPILSVDDIEVAFEYIEKISTQLKQQKDRKRTSKVER